MGERLSLIAGTAGTERNLRTFAVPATAAEPCLAGVAIDSDNFRGRGRERADRGRRRLTWS